MSDAHQPFGQDMQQEAPAKFITCQDHATMSPAAAIVLVTQRHGSIVDPNHSSIADSDRRVKRARESITVAVCCRQRLL